MISQNVCKDFMYDNCTRTECKFTHPENACFYYWKYGSCKKDTECTKQHFTINPKSLTSSNSQNVENENVRKKNKKNKDKYNKELRKSLGTKRVKNTVCFDPMDKPVDMRISYDLGRRNEKVSSKITSREVLLVPNLFNDFKPGEIYRLLVSEIENCGIPQDKLLKLWHGNDKIQGTHLIADDKLKIPSQSDDILISWKSKCPTFEMVIYRIKQFFEMNVASTRLNWYKDNSQWKPFHHDAAAVKSDKINTQNFTVGVSFGDTREAAFENAQTKTVISLPQPDGCIYAFSKDTNMIWRHGILQEKEHSQNGRISIIAWGWIDNQINL